MESGIQTEFILRITPLELDANYSIRSLDSFELNDTHVRYRAEGNANIVLSLSQRRQVLRFSKSNRLNTCCTYANGSDKLFYVHKYIETVCKLFDTNDTPVLIKVDISDICSFHRWLDKMRPEFRRTKQPTDFCFNYALLYPDACYITADSSMFSNQYPIDSYAIEIKPKQGWSTARLPASVLTMCAIKSTALTKCRFCAMQYLKMKENQCGVITKFCPLDLFSGKPVRMIRALKHLMHCPSNNFRIFKNGDLVYAENSNLDELKNLLQSIFRKNDSFENLAFQFCVLLAKIMGLNIDSTNNELVTWAQVEDVMTSTECVEANPCSLPNTSILRQILDLQLLALESISNVSQNCAEISLNDDQWPLSHIAQLNAKLCDFNRKDNNDMSAGVLSNKFGLSFLELYEIGATALDCSIMLNVKHCDANIAAARTSTVIEMMGIPFDVKARVFDLDPKLYPNHFKKFVQRTKESYDAFYENISMK